MVIEYFIEWEKIRVVYEHLIDVDFTCGFINDSYFLMDVTTWISLPNITIIREVT